MCISLLSVISVFMRGLMQLDLDVIGKCVCMINMNTGATKYLC